ncbi:D-glycero-beta-D-manno-heptose-7-phosphate kinase [Caulobacter segnis]|uniref:D-glycero-beta-D-manno-heptose-7-phosphate kinase n=1 Tax=Caulobacter segnis TaxID=88688 RepID=UPI0024108829|nr:D-glycero-beta-D-manno-heptose-7-phosphate kinase [Caulobacter segnis]MDG2521297.1 D-glycero-beta-D-manno-heptose-7-phosphate kinase [Caulobacter segnis]
MLEIEQVGRLVEGRVVVVGDLMLDHYVFGQVDRVSPEAPVPVLHVGGERWTLGGAANVAANILALGGQADLIGVVGDDADGARLAGLLDTPHGAATAHLVKVAGRQTALKTRYLSGQQQMIRVDREDCGPLTAQQEDAVVEAVARTLADGGVLVVSDYGKGLFGDRVLQAIFEVAKRKGATTIVDPKRRDLSAYRGADFITPNRKELALSTGLPCESDAEAQAAADAAFAVSGAAVLLTRSEKGMSLFRDGVDPVHLATAARSVFDVSGAGDTVVAAVSLGLASGLRVEAAMRLANAAAGVVVAKHGTAVATPGELVEELRGPAQRTESVAGLLPLKGMSDLRADWARQGLTVGFTNGCFDLVHPGHVSLLKQAAEQCDRLIVALNTDASVSRLKGPKRPIQPLEARARVIAAIKGVDAVVAFDEETPLSLIETLRPDVLIKGADYTEEAVVGGDVVKAGGGRVYLANLVDGQSTTAIAARAGG